MTRHTVPAGYSRDVSRRRMLAQGAAAAATPLLVPFPLAHAQTLSDLRYLALLNGDQIGEHAVTFQMDGDDLIVETHIDIKVKALFFTVFRLKHEARETWRAGRLVSVTSTTNRDGTRLQISGNTVEGGFLIDGEKGSFLASGNLLTTNSLWDSRFVNEVKLIDVQYGGEVGLIARPLGEEQVDTPQGPVLASRYQIVTPQYAGSVFYDEDQRWVKALIEAKGETIEYVLAT